MDTYSTTSMSRPPGVSAGHSTVSFVDGTYATAPRAPQVHSASDLGNVGQIQYVAWVAQTRALRGGGVPLRDWWTRQSFRCV